MNVMKKITALICVMTLLTVASPVYAATVTSEGEYDVTVSATINASFTVAIPDSFSLSQKEGTTYSATYEVGAKGMIGSDQCLNIVPVDSFAMTNASGDASVTATVNQTIKKWKYASSATSEALTLSNTEFTYTQGTVTVTFNQAGTYSGVLGFSVFID